MAFGHAKERFNRIRTDRQTEMSQSERRGRAQLIVEIGPKLSAQRGRRHRLNEGLTLRPRGVRETVLFENFLALKQAAGVLSKALNEGFAGRKLIEAGAELGHHRSRLGATH